MALINIAGEPVLPTTESVLSAVLDFENEPYPIDLVNGFVSLPKRVYQRRVESREWALSNIER